jgi:hypothetical protein
VNVNRDIIARLEALGLRYYITGSEALAVYGEPRQTRDIDIVIDAGAADYERAIRPAFADAYLVNDLIASADRSYGAVIHRIEIAKADLILAPSGAWAREALDRRRRIDDPVLGSAWFVSAEDLILAKLDWSDGGASERQVRDCRSVVRIHPDLDWDYLARHARELGVVDLLESLRGDRPG